MNGPGGWPLRVALEEYAKGRQRRIRMLALTGGLASVLALLSAVIPESLPAELGPIATLLAIAVLIAMVVDRRRADREIEVAGSVGIWLARANVLDGDGRLASVATEAAADEGSEDRLPVVVTAYQEAARRSARGERWIEPLLDVASLLDTADVRAEIRERATLRFRPAVWAVITPLALLGLLLLGLVVLDAVTRALS